MGNSGPLGSSNGRAGRRDLPLLPLVRFELVHAVHLDLRDGAVILGAVVGRKVDPQEAAEGGRAVQSKSLSISPRTNRIRIIISASP